MDNTDRVRAASSDEINRKIDQEMMERLRQYEKSDPRAITRRIHELDLEWDMERCLEMNASILALTGLVLGTARRRRWLLLPTVVLPFLLQHAIQGWCPPIPILRRLGIRTRKEIDREKYALKVLRGDFAGVGPTSPAESAMRSAGL
jgi:hypothetical protein